LEDAGCTDAELLGHLRGPGPHVRGAGPWTWCWGRSSRRERRTVIRGSGCGRRERLLRVF
jgi:hypothetical protein